MFTYSILLASSDFQHPEDKGTINFDDFTKVLVNFPWLEQLNEYNKRKQGSSPTISVVDNTSQNALWISIAGNENKKIFLVGYVSKKKVKPFWGLGKSKEKNWVDIYSIQKLNDIILLFKFFFLAEEEKLLSNLLLEEKFDGMAVVFD